jgi:hypothetical protein
MISLMIMEIANVRYASTLAAAYQIRAVDGFCPHRPGNRKNGKEPVGTPSSC